MVKAYDNVLPKNICENLIDLFEKNIQHQHFINHNNCPCFTQVNVNQISTDIIRSLIPYLSDVYNRYRKDINNYYSPPLKELEEFRIKKYNIGGDQRFDEHVDVTDYDSSLRAVAFLFYLNDNDGNTVFPKHGLNIKPVSGKVIIFPPTWEYPHSGLPPKSNSKYIMSTYIHYGKN
tara:strand:- start:41 stop:568 length:528 start_codon:yes stop_codon:yes gene_type:complete